MTLTYDVLVVRAIAAVLKAEDAHGDEPCRKTVGEIRDLYMSAILRELRALQVWRVVPSKTPNRPWQIEHIETGVIYQQTVRGEGRRPVTFKHREPAEKKANDLNTAEDAGC